MISINPLKISGINHNINSLMYEISSISAITRIIEKNIKLIEKAN